MIEPLSIKDLNCRTCPHKIKSTQRLGFMKCDLSNYLITPDTPIGDHMEIVGCASHPLALQVFAQPIVEELERRKDAWKKSMTTYHPLETAVKTTKARMRGIDEAIKLMEGDAP